MNQWINESVNQWINESVIQWNSDRMNQRMSELGSVDETMNPWTNFPPWINAVIQPHPPNFLPVLRSPSIFKRGRNHKLFNMSEWFHNTVVSCGSLAPTWRLKPCNKVFCCEATCNCHRFRMVSLNWREPHGTPFPCPGRSYSDFWHRFFNWQVGPTHEW